MFRMCSAPYYNVFMYSNINYIHNVNGNEKRQYQEFLESNEAASIIHRMFHDQILSVFLLFWFFILLFSFPIWMDIKE